VTGEGFGAAQDRVQIRSVQGLRQISYDLLVSHRCRICGFRITNQWGTS
jgi:hypothetical protein